MRSHLRTRNPCELSDEELRFVISDLIDGEKNVPFNKARRSLKKKRVECETELEKRFLESQE